MLDGELNPNDYQEIKSRLQPEVERLTKETVYLQNHDPEESNIKEFGFLYLRNPGKVFKASTLEEKSAIVGLTYPEKMSFQDGTFQTISGTDIISLLCRSGKGFSLQKGKPQKKFCGLSQEVTPSGFKPETF
jgi:site-specific DNA recombinase